MKFYLNVNLDKRQGERIGRIILLMVQNIKSLKTTALMCFLCFLVLNLFMATMVSGQIEETTAMPYTEYERYACVPSATALILTYLGREPNCPDFFEEFRVDADGLTPASDIIRICERYGLHCNAYRGLSIRQIKNYLSEGFAVILITYNTSRQHAVSLFEAKGDILAADLLQPLHLANMDVLKKTLSHGAVSIVIGENPVPSLNSITQYWYLLILAAVVCVSIFLYFFYNKRRIKNET